MIDLCYWFELMFCCIMIDDDQFFFLAIGLRPVLVQPLSEVDNHLDELSAGEGQQIGFIGSVDVMSGGTHVTHDY